LSFTDAEKPEDARKSSVKHLYGYAGDGGFQPPSAGADTVGGKEAAEGRAERLDEVPQILSRRLLAGGVSVNDKEIKGKVHSAMYALVKDNGFAAPVDVLMSVGVLSKADYENWRFGRVDYLERVCKVNLKKLSTISREMRAYAKQHNLKASWTDYRKWGKGDSNNFRASPQNVRLRFSKSGDEQIERQYGTHYQMCRKAPCFSYGDIRREFSQKIQNSS
jgi:hypothetical protein